MEIKPEQIDQIYLCSVTLEEAEGRFFPRLFYDVPLPLRL